MKSYGFDQSYQSVVSHWPEINLNLFTVCRIAELFENHFQMNRQRRYTAQEALRRMLDLEEDGDDHDDEEEYLTFPNNEQTQGEGRGGEVSEEDDDNGKIQLFNDSEDSGSR